MKSWVLSVLFFAVCLAAAAQTTEREWQEAAVHRYPALGIEGTPLNKAFVAEYQRRKQLPAQAAFFANPRWPMLLADECAQQVAAGTGPAASPRPAGTSTNLATPAASPPPRAFPPLGTFPTAFPSSSIPAIALIIGFVIGLPICLCVAALVVRLATRLVQDFGRLLAWRSLPFSFPSSHRSSSEPSSDFSRQTIA